MHNPPHKAYPSLFLLILCEIPFCRWTRPSCLPAFAQGVYPTPQTPASSGSCGNSISLKISSLTKFLHGLLVPGPSSVEFILFYGYGSLLLSSQTVMICEGGWNISILSVFPAPSSKSPQMIDTSVNVAEPFNCSCFSLNWLKKQYFEF